MVATTRIFACLLLLCCLRTAARGQVEDPATQGGAWIVHPAPAATGGESADERVRRLMQAQIDVVCQGRLDRVLPEIGRVLGVTIKIDAESAEEWEIWVDTEVDWRLRGCTAWEALDFLLDEFDLEAVAAEGRVIVLCEDDAEERIASEVLDIGGLLQAAGPKADAVRFLDNLSKVITTTVQPRTWSGVAGRGELQQSASGYDGRLVLSACESVRRDVKALLAALENAARAKGRVSAFPFIVENAVSLAAFEKPVTLDARGAPLGTVVAEVGRQIGMPINFDRPALDDMGIGLDMPVTFHCRNLRAADALARMLSERELVCICFGGGLMITTQDEAECRIITAVFDIHDIVGRGSRRQSVDSFIDTLTTAIDPRSWDDVGGPASLGVVSLQDRTLLVVSQTQDGVLQVKSLLDRIRRIVRTPQPVLLPRAAEHAAMTKALQKQVEWHFDKTPLDEAVPEISVGLGVDVFIDRAALNDMAIEPDTPIRLPSGRYLAENALRRALRQEELTYLIARGGMMITTQEQAERHLDTAVFDVHDIAKQADDRPDVESLIEAITCTIHPTSWDDVGGAGSVVPLCVGGRTLLVVSQTQDVFSELISVFDRIRRIKQTGQPVLRRRDAERAPIVKALENRVQWHFDKTPLEEAAADVASSLGVDVFLDRRALDNMGIAGDAPISLPDGRYVAKEALRRVLGQNELTYIIADGGVMITTEETAEIAAEVAVYAVGDLLLTGRDDDAPRSVQGPAALLLQAYGGICVPDNSWGVRDRLTTLLWPTTWDDVGGSGSIDIVKSEGQVMFVVSHTQEFHDEMTRFFDALREIRKTRAKARTIESETDAAVRKVLKNRVAWPFRQTPLSEAVARIGADLKVDVYLDRRALDRAGIDPDRTRLSLAFAYHDAQEALWRTLKPEKLSFLIDHGALVITTRKRAEECLKVALYDISDLIAGHVVTPDGLMEAIQEAIEPNTWDAVGGPGVVAYFELPGSRTVLAVVQVERVRCKVERQLMGLRGRR